MTFKISTEQSFYTEKHYKKSNVLQISRQSVTFNRYPRNGNISISVTLNIYPESININGSSKNNDKNIRIDFWNYINTITVVYLVQSIGRRLLYSNDILIMPGNLYDNGFPLYSFGKEITNSEIDGYYKYRLFRMHGSEVIFKP